jgi:protein-tyrosine phosphatase
VGICRAESARLWVWLEPVIDLHCHILPELDDGARDLPDSLAMAAEAAADGIEVVCATPHLRHDHELEIAALTARVRRLNQSLGEAGIELLILRGAEVAETSVEELTEEQLSQVALGAGRWILLEPAPGPLSEGLANRVRHLGRHGHRALIAHPERHISADMFERLAALVAAGALVQATADDFLREQTAAGMMALAEAGLIHVLGSDSHSSRYGRPLRLGGALGQLATLERLIPHLGWISEAAPRAIIEGAALERPFDPQI